MICSNCGRQIPDGVIFCPVCGAAPNAGPVQTPNAGAYYSQQQPAGYRPAYAGSAYTEPQKAKSAQTMSVVGLCFQYFNVFPLVGLILCIVGLASANQSRAFSGGDYSPSAKVGRVCGIIGIVLAVIKVVAAITLFILTLVLFGSLAGLIGALPEIVEEFSEEFLFIAPMIN